MWPAQEEFRTSTFLKISAPCVCRLFQDHQTKPLTGAPKGRGPTRPPLRSPPSRIPRLPSRKIMPADIFASPGPAAAFISFRDSLLGRTSRIIMAVNLARTVSTRWRVGLTTDRIVSTQSAFYDSSRVVFDGLRTRTLSLSDR